jgi:hypothetical protein
MTFGVQLMSHPYMASAIACSSSTTIPITCGCGSLRARTTYECHAQVPEKLRRKLGEKAFRGIMVGYPRDAPGYRVYNPDTRRITTSVHVVF